MSYHNPFHLLSDAQFASFNEGDIKKIKNELLLHFQFSADATVEIQGYEYDKNVMVNLLEELQERHQLHLVIYLNPPLLRFLEEYDIGFFRDIPAQKKVALTPQYKESIDVWVATAINEMLPDHILQFTEETSDLLHALYSYTQSMSAATRTLAYSQSYEKFKNFVDELPERYPLPYQPNLDFNFYPELQFILTREVLNFFKHLPSEFDYCRIQFALWCNNNIVIGLIQKDRNLGSWKRDELSQVMEAAVIASTYHNKDGNLKVANDIYNFLTGSRARSGGGRRPSAWLLLFAIIPILRLFSTCNDSYNGPKNRHVELPTYSKEQLQEILEKKGMESDTKTFDGGAAPAKTKPVRRIPVTASQFNGGFAMKPFGRKLKDVREKGDTVIIEYTAEIIPTCLDCLEDFVPDNVLTPSKKNGPNVRLTIHKKSLPGISFSFPLIIHSSDSARTAQAYEAGSKKEIVVIQPFAIRNYRYKGFVTLIDTLGKIINRDTIELRRTGTEKVTVLYNGKLIDISNDPDKKSDANSKRMSYALHNLEALSQQRLYTSRETSLKEIKLYRFAALNRKSSSLPDSINMLSTNNATILLSYLFTSGTDEISFYAYTNQEVDIKYMVDRSNGYVEGMQIATLGNKKSVVERIELFKVRE